MEKKVGESFLDISSAVDFEKYLNGEILELGLSFLQNNWEDLNRIIYKTASNVDLGDEDGTLLSGFRFLIRRISAVAEDIGMDFEAYTIVKKGKNGSNGHVSRNDILKGQLNAVVEFYQGMADFDSSLKQ